MEYAYVGSYTTEKRGGLGRGGISVFRRGARTERWEEIQTVERTNPSYLCFGRDERFLYAVQADGEQVAAFSLDPSTGMLTYLNEHHIGFRNGVFCQTDKKGDYLIVSSCSRGNGGIVVFRIAPDGSLGEITDIVVPDGEEGPLDVQRTTKPHQTCFDAEYRYLVESDKGMDQEVTYSLDTQTGTLTKVSTTKMRPASCPRHIAFHPNGKMAYVLTERFGTVVPCKYEEGVLTPLRIIPLTPPEFLGNKDSAAEIEVHPNGRFLFVTTRGFNAIFSFGIMEDGLLEPISRCQDGISKVRHFKLSADGKRMFCANETGHSVSEFRIDSETGTVEFLNDEIKASAPACVILRTVG